MYGLVNQAVQGMVIAGFGEDIWERIKRDAGVDLDAFVSMESYDDSITYSLVEAGSAVLNLSPEAILRAFGEYWVLETAAEGYAELMQAAGSTLPEFIGNLDQLHSRVLMTSVRSLALLGLCVASTTACSMTPNRDLMFTQLATTAESSKLHATIVQYGEPGRGSWRGLRSAAATIDLDAGTLALGHLVSGDAGDVGLHAVALTSNYSFSLDVAAGVATITASSSDTVVATFDTPGSVVAWFVSEALGLAYVVHERPSDSEQRVLIAPLGCGASCVVTDTQLGGGNDYFDTMNMRRVVLVDDAAQVVRLPVPCCICVSHASYRFDEVGMHSSEAL